MTSRIWLPPGWPRLLLLALPLALAAAGLLAVIVYSPSPQAPAATVPPAPNPNGDTQAAGADALPGQGGLLVQVSGAVASPGLYRLAKGERVSAAIAAAGGFSADADPEKLPDLAARLRDGQHVKVPSRRSSSSRSPSSTRTSRPTAASLNSATADELATIPGFSAELAADAVRYRTEYGGFLTTRELVTVLGMSEADYVRARRYLTV